MDSDQFWQSNYQPVGDHALFSQSKQEWNFAECMGRQKPHAFHRQLLGDDPGGVATWLDVGPDAYIRKFVPLARQQVDRQLVCGPRLF